MEGEEEEEGEEKEEDEDEDEDEEGEGERDGDGEGEGEGEGEEREEGEKRKGWTREMNEENEELFGVEKRGKERMAGWWVVREKFVRAREAWAERKSGDFVAGLTWQVEEQMVADEWCWAVRNGQPLRGMMLRWVTHKEALTIFRLV
ncbi:uncharacterized protein MONOS_10196 [Monocercomonoides exilis]|uniref:uncharacterized protein n=1 Tax=Monocercomonoides exilis TaxID=2049356 RepID=UPI003559E212|nr:hypothetical protein MONOS_10196 [Monocercomonoides exilis]